MKKYFLHYFADSLFSINSREELLETAKFTII